MSGGPQEAPEIEPLLTNEEGHLQTSASLDQSGSPDSANDEQLEYKRTLSGFLSYSAAAEAFSIVSVALFLPLCLEAFARENGSLAPLHELKCPSESPVPQQSDQEATCEVRLLGIWINTSSFSLFTYSVSVLSQAAVFITLGSQANHPATRRNMLFSSAAVGSLSMMIFIFLDPSSAIWPLAALLSVIGNVAFGLGNVCLNAYLPPIARSLAARKSSQLNESERADTWAASQSRATSFVSAVGIGTGYAVGICALLLCLIPVLILHGSTFSMRIAIASSGAWWALFSVPAFFLLRTTSSKPKLGLTFTDGWIGLFHIFKEAKQLKQTMKYLLAYIFLSDAFATIMSTATLFAKTVVNMPASGLILVGILAPLSGVVGAFVVPMVANATGASNLRTLLCLCCAAALVPAYGCLALIFPIEHGQIGSLSTHTEIYGFSVLFGLLYGAFQSYSRALYSELIPAGEEARFFSLYAITDKSSSFLGPFLVALLSEYTGNLRYGFVVILCGMTLPLPILAALDIDEGRQHAAAFSSTHQP